MFGLFSLALLAMITLGGEGNQKFVSVDSIESLPAAKTGNFVSPPSAKMAGFKLTKTTKAKVRTMPLVKIFEERGLNTGQISGWAQNKETGVHKMGKTTPDWVK